MYPYLTGVIESVANEQEINPSGYQNDVYEDHIDKKVRQMQYDLSFKDCLACGMKSIPKAKINCPPGCRKNLKSSKLEHDGTSAKGTYEEPQKRSNIASSTDKRPKGVGVSFLENPDGKHTLLSETLEESTAHDGVDPVKYFVKDPVFVNPCSYEACLSVLRDIGKQAGIKQYGTGNREWVTVCCDGSPYVLCLRMIQSTFVCNACGFSIIGLDAIQSHTKIHEEPAEYSLEFDSVLLIPGAGHIEMNMVKCMVEFGWHIFWRELAFCMNFRTENALNACERVSDNHKGWELITIARKLCCHLCGTNCLNVTMATYQCATI